MSRIVDKKRQEIERHVISALVDNEFGVLSRVIGLFSARGYNIASVTVAEVDDTNNISRITVVTEGPMYVVEQIQNQLGKLIPVHKVKNLTIDSPHIEREVALIKVVCKGQDRTDAQQLADRFGARTIDSTETSFVFELSDIPEKLDKFIRLLKPYGLAEVCRTGITAISRGAHGMTLES